MVKLAKDYDKLVKSAINNLKTQGMTESEAYNAVTKSLKSLAKRKQAVSKINKGMTELAKKHKLEYAGVSRSKTTSKDVLKKLSEY